MIFIYYYIPFFYIFLLNFFLLTYKFCKNIKHKSPQNFWYAFENTVIWGVYVCYLKIGMDTNRGLLKKKSSICVLDGSRII